MDDFLKNCYNNIFENVTIDDTLKYIEDYPSDTEAVINSYKEIIDADKICKLVNSDRFLSTYNYYKKVEIVCNFFGNLYNYAKNLIKNFDIYSSKVIQDSSIIMKDTIMLFPHYKRYMQRLLGYEFNETNKEWIMKQPNSREFKYQLAAVCIITATGHQMIKQLDKDEKSESSVSGISSVRVSNPSIDGHMWVCQACGFNNNVLSANCGVCYTEREALQPAVDGTGDKWTCNICSCINDDRNRRCMACYDDRKMDNNARRPDQCGWKCDYCDCDNVVGDNECVTCQMIRNVSQDSSSEEIEAKVDEWACDKCEFRNNVRNKQCEVCGQQKKGEEREKWFCKKCTFGNDSGDSQCRICGQCCTERHPETVVGRDQWQCRICQCVNNDTDRRCAACSNENRDRHRLDNVRLNIRIGSAQRQCRIMRDQPSCTAIRGHRDVRDNQRILIDSRSKAMSRADTGPDRNAPKKKKKSFFRKWFCLGTRTE